MTNQSTPQEKWLSLSAAASYLNVHPTTLRRWADQGQIPLLVTPGGHRRFALSQLKLFSEAKEVHDRKGGVEKAWAKRALVDTRQGITKQSEQSWMSHFDDTTRNQYRQMGQQLMGLTLQFISQQNEDMSLLNQAHQLGLVYGEAGLQVGLPLKEALQAAMFFRDTLIETALQLPGNTSIKPEANLRLLKRINSLLNTVHLAIAEVYDAH